jgi:hypothetical protein
VQNRDERTGQQGLFAWRPDTALAELTKKSQAVDTIGDDTPEEVRRKKQVFEQTHADPIWQRQREACDLWTAAFFQPLQPDAPAITSGTLADHLAGYSNSRLRALARKIHEALAGADQAVGIV